MGHDGGHVVSPRQRGAEWGGRNGERIGGSWDGCLCGRLLHHGEQQHAARHFRQLRSPMGHGGWHVVAARERFAERGEWNGELRQPKRSGEILTLESRWTRLRDESGQPKGLLMINSDITEKKQLEMESLRMQRMESIGALAGGMAHDLNNVLAPILMGTQLLRRDVLDENTRRILSLMESSTRRGADMVRQVLLFARGHQGDFERLDLRPILNEAENLAHDTFPQNIVVSAQVADDLWPVRGNATQLHQVVLNLCVNARDALSAGGSLSLSADNVELTENDAKRIVGASPGPFVVLMVGDTGSGIPTDVVGKIFDPFFTTKQEGQGTGLGLSTVARIVKAHGGFLAVQSVLAEGTTFEVYLPRYTEPTIETLAQVHGTPPRGRGELILVADDDNAVREVLRCSLEEHGYRVVTAANGAEAVSVYKRTNGVALFICDYSMSVVDGPKAAAAIRGIRRDLPVIFLSGEIEAIDWLGQGLFKVEYLHKPVDLESLLRAASRALIH